MEHWHKGKIVEFEKQKPLKDERKRFLSHRYKGTDEGYSENNVVMIKQKDGAICFSGDGDGAFVYLYPEQVRHLREFLK